MISKQKSSLTRLPCGKPSSACRGNSRLCDGFLGTSWLSATQFSASRTCGLTLCVQDLLSIAFRASDPATTIMHSLAPANDDATSVHWLHCAHTICVTKSRAWLRKRLSHGKPPDIKRRGWNVEMSSSHHVSDLVHGLYRSYR